MYSQLILVSERLNLFPFLWSVYQLQQLSLFEKVHPFQMQAFVDLFTKSHAIVTAAYGGKRWSNGPV